MKCLVVFYSRTGNTKKVAEKIAEMLNCDLEEIIDIKNRSGLLGFLRSGFEAVLKKLTIIAKTKYNPDDYDLVIIGTPVWAGTISTPIRTYMIMNKDKFKKVAFFCTLIRKTAPKVFKEMKEVCQKEPISTIMIRASEINSGIYAKKLEEFVSKIKNLNNS
ncbi:MAG: flavodoxin [Candidatus Methanomethylicaceae archaeon]|nr:flavodoxin [Candidatus Verstraetearchaeota archaeon]